MDTLQRLKWVISTHREEDEVVESEHEGEGDQKQDEYQETEFASQTHFGKKLGNFKYRYLPLSPPLMIRGETYRMDHIKIPSGEHKFDFVGMEVYAHKKAPGGILKDWKDSNYTTLHTLMEAKQFKLVVHFLVPGRPHLTASMYFLAKEGVLEQDSKFAKLFKKFASKELPNEHGEMSVEAADAYRTKTFKFIPRFVKGASMAKRLAGEKPAIICRKIPSKYYVGDDYLEIDLDISGSRIAGAVLGLVKKQLKGMVLDMIFLLEGKDASELPEELIGGLRIFNPSLDNVPQYATSA